MKKFIALGISVAVVVGLIASGTWALFSDTETSEDNQMTAGVIDLEVDCAGDTTFSPQDDPLPKIFNYLPANDIKPGDDGEVTLSLHLKTDSNDADLWMQVLNLTNDGGANPEPEIEEETSSGVDDDIASEIEVLLWLDEGATEGWQGTGTDSEEGDNIKQAGEETLYDGTLDGLTSAGVSGKLGVMDDAVACTTYYVGWSWELPSSVGNEHQGDYCTFDIVFGAEQVVTP
jgi:predicted ribosomally synthesized peptide with SipW-like signal peptide